METLMENRWKRNGKDVIPRNRDFFELFAGRQERSRTLESRGLCGEAFDRETIHRSMDLCILEGLIYAGCLVCTVVVGGTLWMSPQCSCWPALVSTHSTRRRADYIMGEETLAWAMGREANICARAVYRP